MKKIITISILLVLISVVDCHAESNIKVRVWVSGNEELDGIVASYIERELRTLGDVIPVTKEGLPHDFSIMVTVTAKDENQKFHMACVFTENISNALQKSILPYVDASRYSEIKDLLQFAEIVTHNVSIYKTDYNMLKKSCESIVTKFDRLCLKKTREDIAEHGGL